MSVVLTMLAVAAVTLSSGPVADSGEPEPPEPDSNVDLAVYSGLGTSWPDVKPASSGIPEAPIWSKGSVDWADERMPVVPPVTDCPLDAAGCAAAESILRSIETGNDSDILAKIEPQFRGPLISSKPDLQIDDATALSSALDVARHRLTVAIGCPGPGPGSCEDVFVLAVDITPVDRQGPPRALAFVFVRSEHTFEFYKALIQPYFDIAHGGLSMTLSLPLDLTGGYSGLWYTPWTR